MKAPKQASPSQKLISKVQLGRVRLAKAERQLAAAKVQARLAKRRRKEAKEAARRAKKQARLAKQELAEAKLALTEAEESLGRSGGRAAKTKTRKKPAAKAAATKPKKSPARVAASPAPKPVKRHRPKPVAARARPVRRPSAEAGSLPITVPRDIVNPEAPDAPTPNEAGDQPAERS